MTAIKDPKHKRAARADNKAIIWPPKNDDPTHVKLLEKGWALAQQVFHPPDPWLTKDANAFINKNLTLVEDQKKKLESHL